MRIAFFTETYPPYINGIATQTEMLKRTFESMGHQVLIVTVCSEKLDQVKVENNIVYLPGVELKKIYNYRVSLPITHEKLDYVDKFEPDVIHVQNEFAVGIAGMRYAKKNNIPLIYTLHSEYDRFLFYVGLGKFTRISQKVSDIYLKKIPKNADVCTSPSPKAQAYLDRQGIYKKVVVIDNAIENKLFLPNQEKDDFRKQFRSDFDLGPNTKAFVFVGRVGKEKNIEELITNYMASDIPYDKARLFIIGDGPDREAIVNLIDNNNFQDRIVYLGRKPNTEIPKYLAAMDFYTTGSLSEMHSISMLEGMASGLPAIIKLDLPNINQIKPGVNGFHWNTQEDFIRIFEQMVNLSDEDYKKLKESTLQYIEDNNNINQAKILLDLYQKAINEKLAD